jgi:hypothetical protein
VPETLPDLVETGREKGRDRLPPRIEGDNLEIRVVYFYIPRRGLDGAMFPS